SASSIERTKPPAYLFRYQICQRARDKNQTSAPYHLRRARPTITSDFFQTNQRRRRPIRPAVRLSAAGEGVSTATNKHPQPLFHKNIKKDGFLFNFNGLDDCCICNAARAHGLGCG
ncbi:MAG: hypothetical protein VXY73_15715, partial [Pseudomonadota bacterium]|nr:hypothetical protein [Pseudomonadota bacterium]